MRGMHTIDATPALAFAEMAERYHMPLLQLNDVVTTLDTRIEEHVKQTGVA